MFSQDISALPNRFSLRAFRFSDDEYKLKRIKAENLMKKHGTSHFSSITFTFM